MIYTLVQLFNEESYIHSLEQFPIIIVLYHVPPCLSEFHESERNSMRSVFFVKLRGWHGIFLCYRTEVAALFIYQWILYMYINNVLSVIQLTEIVAVSL